MIKNIGHTGLNTHRKNGGREQDRGETERERVGERGRVLLQTSDGASHKFDRWRKNL